MVVAALAGRRVDSRVSLPNQRFRRSSAESIPPANWTPADRSRPLGLTGVREVAKDEHQTFRLEQPLGEVHHHDGIELGHGKRAPLAADVAPTCVGRARGGPPR